MALKEKVYITKGMSEITDYLAKHSDALSTEVSARAFEMMHVYREHTGDTEFRYLGVILANDPDLFVEKFSAKDRQEKDLVMFSILLRDDKGRATDILYSLTVDLRTGTVVFEEPYEPDESDGEEPANIH